MSLLKEAEYKLLENKYKEVLRQLVISNEMVEDLNNLLDFLDDHITNLDNVVQLYEDSKEI